MGPPPTEPLITSMTWFARIFECDLSDVKLYRQLDGAFRDENGHGWKVVAHHEKVETGIYLCKVGKGISPYSIIDYM